MKLPHRGNGQQEIFDHQSALATFGGGFDIHLVSKCNRSYLANMSYCDLGSSYELPEGITRPSKEQKSFLAGDFYFSVAELEVF